MDSQQPSPQRVLVVDDDRVLRMALSRLLAESYEVEEAGDGHEALAKVAAAALRPGAARHRPARLSGLDVLAAPQRRRAASPRRDDDGRRHAGNAAARHPRPGLRLHRQAVSAQRDPRRGQQGAGGARRRVEDSGAVGAPRVGGAAGALLARRRGPAAELRDAAGHQAARRRARVGGDGVSRAAVQRHRVGRQARRHAARPDRVPAVQADAALSDCRPRARASSWPT